MTRPPAKGKGKGKGRGKGDDQGKGIAALQLGSISWMLKHCQSSCLHRRLKPSEAMQLLGKQFPGYTHPSAASLRVIVILRCFGIHADPCLLGERGGRRLRGLTIPTIPQGNAREAQGQASAHRRSDKSVEDEIPVASWERASNQAEGGQSSP